MAISGFLARDSFRLRCLMRVGHDAGEYPFMRGEVLSIKTLEMMCLLFLTGTHQLPTCHLAPAFYLINPE